MTMTIFILWIIVLATFSYMTFAPGVAVTQTLPELRYLTLSTGKEDPKPNIVAVEQNFPSLVLKD